jgi:hypothetical protein
VARFERGGRFTELWLTEGDPWRVLWRRDGDLADEDAASPERVHLEYTFGAEREVAALIGELLRAGWQRVPDPARETPCPDEDWDPALAAALRSGDLDAALVLGDVLQEHGHPRGALIAIQRAREDRPDDAELRGREAELLADAAPVLLGALVPHVSPEEGDQPTLLLTWKRGFIERARIDGHHDRGASEQILWELLRHPSARFLRELEIGCHSPGDQDNTLMADVLIHAQHAPPLRRLFLGDFDDTNVDQIDISRAPIGDLTGLGTRYPMLEDLIVKGTGDAILDLRLPLLRRFAYRTSSLRRATLAAIVAADWPVLEDLEIWFGASEYGSECDASDIPSLLAIDAPLLRALRLMNAEFTDELVEHVVASPLAQRLEELDFSLGTLTRDGGDQLARHAAAFPRLRRLAVYDCALDDAALARMRDAGLPVDETPCSPAEAQCLAWRQESRPTDYRNHRRPRMTQKRNRYVSDSE